MTQPALWRRDVAPVLATLVALPILSLAVGAALGRLVTGYAVGAAIVGLFLSNPEFLDLRVYRRLEVAWRKRRATKKLEGLPEAKRRYSVRQYRIGRALRVALWLVIVCVASGLLITVLGLLVSLGASWGDSMAQVGAMAFLAGGLLLVVTLVAGALAPIRPPEVRFLDGYLLAHDAASVLHDAKATRGVFALALVLVGGALALATS